MGRQFVIGRRGLIGVVIFLVKTRGPVRGGGRRHGGVQVDEAWREAHGRDRPRLQVRICYVCLFMNFLLLLFLDCSPCFF
jgi:hypothetical protein